MHSVLSFCREANRGHIFYSNLEKKQDLAGDLVARLQRLHQPLDDVKMARSCIQTYQDVTNFDGCGFGKYWLISFRLSLLVTLDPSHNLLVRGSNPCGGTKSSRQLRKYYPHRFFPEWLANRPMIYVSKT